MLKLQYGNRPVVEKSQRIDAGIYVNNYLFEGSEPKSICKKQYDLSKEGDVRNLISHIEAETNVNLRQDNYGKIEYSEPNKVRLTYIKSNLGRGFIFWFICNVCGNRVKYLYFPPNSTTLACRKCHKLTYSKQKESKRMRSYRNMLGS